jgi:tetratricopeptide (TPR) repeat protein
LIKAAYKILLLAVTIIVMYSCSNEKNSIVNRSYHNTTSRYNGYFNGKESVNEGLEKIANNYQEDFTQLLPLFIEGDDAAARSVYPEMDRAIEKCTDVIQNHSMYIKKVEYCKWIDNSYLMIGIANYYKKDYKAANEMFAFVAKEYEENSERYEALMWMGKSFAGMKNFNKASANLNEAMTNGDLSNREKAKIRAIRADIFIKMENYSAASNALTNAINLTKNKAQKARFTFILAQLYQLQNNPSDASRQYAKVIKMNPDYEMAFYAKINRAMSYEKGSGNIIEIREELTKMLKDEKNIDFYDQIYFALGELELKQGNKKEGIANLELSAEQTSTNVKQKTKTHLKLAKLYFNDKDYINAQSNYDSTVTFMDKNRDDYLDILDTRNGLTSIVKDIKIIQREDSLQHLASLTRKEIDKVIGNIIDEIIDEENRVKQEKFTEQQNMLQQGQNQQPGAGGGWYFYNPNTVNFGKADFAKKWGDRKLEDNWRRKDKTSNSGFTEEIELEQLEEEDTLASANDFKSPNYYLKNIPFTDKKMQTSNDAIRGALYDLGVQYKEELNNTPEAIKTFENLIERYDTSEFHLNSYYQLYRLYLNEGNSSKSNYYKNLILKKYPDTQYALLLENPNYFEDIKEKQKEEHNIYEQTYNRYASKNYSGVITSCKNALTQYPESEFKTKFLYLEALALSAIKDTAQLKETLINLKDNYGSTEEGILATAALNRLITGDSPVENPEVQEEDSKYTFKADQKHNFILLMPTSVMSDANVKKAISNFNMKYYRKSNLKISSVLFGSDKRMYVVKDFNNVFSAKDYFNTFTENTEELSQINAALFNSFAISLDNYPTFYKAKDVDGYEIFFIKNYKN